MKSIYPFGPDLSRAIARGLMEGNADETNAIRLDLGGDGTTVGYAPVPYPFPLRPPDNSVDEIRASHVLNHFSHRQTLAVLTDWVRALKPGGKLKVAVPDFKMIATAFANNQPLQHPAEAYLMGGHADENDRHGAIFYEEKLRVMFRQLGLIRVRRWDADANDCSAFAVSLNLEGVKPTPVKIENLVAVMSVPRYGPTAAFDSGYRSLLPQNIPMKMGFGAYWHEVLTKAIDEILVEYPACKYVLAIDYDSLFTAKDVEELYRLAEENPDADAICGTQIRRGQLGVMLRTDADASFDGDLTKANTAHFGCTIIRVSALKSFGRPWFQAVPDANGGFAGKGFIAADVNFWLRWNAEGKTLYQANTVALGHLEEVAIWPTRELTPFVQQVTDYRKEGQPVEVWR